MYISQHKLVKLFFRILISCNFSLTSCTCYKCLVIEDCRMLSYGGEIFGGFAAFRL